MKEMFGNGTKVLISVGGWGAYFNVTAATETSRALFAKNVAKMLADTGADGVGKCRWFQCMALTNSL